MTLQQELPENITRLLKQRYFLPNEIAWAQVAQRVTDHVCHKEDLTFKALVYQDLRERIWLPNSPALFNSGTRNSGLFACFVAGPSEDTLEAHADTLKHIAMVAKVGGGCGFTGTFIRPKGSMVDGSTHGYAYGPNAWAIRVSDYMAMITQAGKRGMALMYTLRSDHPDLDEFIDLKSGGDESYASNFNQSVMATDAWMAKAQQPGTKESTQFERIVANAHANGEPGLLFYDTINRQTPYALSGQKIEATNPCGEQPLPRFGSCNLGSINLSHEAFYYKDGRFNYDKLKHVVHRMTRFLDDVGSTTRFPNELFASWYDRNRPVGVGIMGFADALFRLGLRYGGPESQTFANSVMELLQAESYKESQELGRSRGIPDDCRWLGRRNATTVTIAPTGSIALIAGCSHSFEPVFSPSFTRTDERGEQYEYVHPLAQEPYFASAINGDQAKVVTWQQHVDIQAVAQANCDSGVSKTVNFQRDATIDNVRDAMLYAYNLGCKGITVYRQDSRSKEVLVATEADIAIQNCPSDVCEL